MQVALVLVVFLVASALVSAPLWGSWLVWRSRRRRRVFRALAPLGATKVRGALASFNLAGHVARVYGIGPWHLEIDDLLPTHLRLLVAHDYGEHHKGAVGGSALVSDMAMPLAPRAVDIVTGFAIWCADPDVARQVFQPRVVAAFRQIPRLATASTKDGTLRLMIDRASLLGSPELELPELLAAVGAFVDVLQQSQRQGALTR